MALTDPRFERLERELVQVKRRLKRLETHEIAIVGGSGGAAPADAQYVVMAASTLLTVERIAAATAPISLADGGAGGPATWSHADSGVGAGVYGDATNVPQITVNATGHVTDVTEVAISGSGSAVAGQVAYWDTNTTIAGDAGLTYDAATDSLTLLSSSSTRPRITLENTNGDAQAQVLEFYKNSGSPGDGDDLGAIDFFGETSTGAQDRYAYILSESLDVTNGDTGGGLTFVVVMDSTERNLLEIAGYNGAVNEGEIIFNEDGQDVDLRFETPNYANAYCLDGGTDRHGFGINDPDSFVEIDIGTATDRILTVRGSTTDNRTVLVTPFYTGTTNGAAAISLSPQLRPAANHALLYGQLNIITTAVSSSDITSLYGVYYRVDTAASYSGALTNIHTLRIAGGTMGGSSPATQVGLYIENQTVGTANNYAIVTNAGNVVFNEGGNASSDVRVEGDSLTHLLFTDADVDRVAVGHATPDRLLHVEESDTNTNTIRYLLRETHAIDAGNTPAALCGVGIEHELMDSARNAQVASEQVTLWAVATSGSESPLYRLNTYPQGSAGPGYSGQWTWDALDGTARTMVPNGAGDAIRGFVCNADCWAITGADTTSGNYSVTAGTTVEIYNDGTDVVQLQMAADGSVTVQRTAGADTFKVSIWGTWIYGT